MMKLYVNYTHTAPNALARIIADMTNQEIEVIVVDEEMKKTKEYKELTTTGKFPMLITQDG